MDSLTRVGNRPKVHVSLSFLPGTVVTIVRGKEVLVRMTVKEIPVDKRGWTTNELIFTEPLPKTVRKGDLVIFEDING